MLLLIENVENKTKNDLNSLPNEKVLYWSKSKAFADDRIKVLKMMILVFDRVENIVVKGENAGYQHFLLFLQCFQGLFYTRLIKVGFCVVKS